MQHLWLQRMKWKGSSWFETFILKSIKMSIKLYSFLEQKQKNGKMNTDLNVLTTYKYVLDRAFYKRRKWKSRNDWTSRYNKQKRRELRLKL
jgi:hypothetical protein